MPKAKRYRGRRLTRQPAPQKSPRQKEHGRPKGTAKKFSFEQTRLGFMLKYECPAIYEVLMRIVGASESAAPKVELIELVCKNASDSSLKKAKFKRYLEEYRECGLYCHRAQVMTPKRRIYYERIRKNKLEEYIRNNGKRIVREMKF